MIYEMKLSPQPFEKILLKTKEIEFRLNDEKRKQLKIGDEIIFTNLNTNENLKVKIINLSYFKTFLDAFSKFVDYNNLSPEINAKNMNKYYSQEKQNKYEVLAIHIKLI